MSAFHRFLFSIFLFLALGCFWASSAFADTTHIFYQNSYSECSTDSASMCTKQMTKVVYAHKKQLSCDTSSGDVRLYYEWWLINSQDGSKYNINQENTNAGNKRIKVCESGTTFKLTGCVAECVPDPCNALKDQEFSQMAYCGTTSCPDGGTLATTVAGTATCTNGIATLLPQPDQNVTDVSNSCAGSLAPSTVASNFKVFVSDNGKSTFPYYCQATYKYTGSTGNQQDDLSGLVSLSFSGITPTTENGQCPDKTVKGQINNDWVCVPDSQAGTGSGCGTGMIKDNSGTCVPFAEAGTGGTGTGTGGTGSGGTGSGGTGSGGGGSGTCNPQTGTGCAPEGTENAGEGHCCPTFSLQEEPHLMLFLFDPYLIRQEDLF